VQEMITYDDVLLSPKFSFIRSRKDVDTTINFLGLKLTTPIISSNMDTVTTTAMALSMGSSGAGSCLHRFASVEDNVAQFASCILSDAKTYNKPMVSIGISIAEFERGVALVEAGADIIVIDVAHGAQIAVVEQYNRLREKYGSNIGIVVGNFATLDSINSFNAHSPFPLEAIKVGIGNGAACTTRIKTGFGIPQLSAIINCAKSGLPLIGDGGCKSAGDVVKSIAAGASAIMAGRMLAGTSQTPVFYRSVAGNYFSESEAKKYFSTTYGNVYDALMAKVITSVKLYRGSASAMSYEAQGKTSEWRTAEGESYEVPAKGSAVDIISDIHGGLRSGMSYAGASTIDEFRKNVEFVRCSTLSNGEHSAHGKGK
jgi:IMP dehydrogenase